MKRKPVARRPVYDLNTREAVEQFMRAADEFDKKYNRTPEDQLALLVREGILTKTGRLTKNYRPR